MFGSTNLALKDLPLASTSNFCPPTIRTSSSFENQSSVPLSSIWRVPSFSKYAGGCG